LIQQTVPTNEDGCEVGFIMVPIGRGSRYYLGLDLGGTSIKGGVVDDHGIPLASVSSPTRAELGPEVGLIALADVARRAVGASGRTWSEIDAIGLGAAGTLDTVAGRIIDTSNLSDWNGFPIGPRLVEQLDRPTILLNDANAAAFGEYWAGAGRSTQSLVLFTLGTGIGCGIVEAGRLLEGRHGLGGECGHATIQMDGGRLCSCGRRGHLEAYASASSLVLRAVEALEREPDSSLRSCLEDGSLSARDIARCASEGDVLAGRLLRETARYLAVGASNLMHTIDPDLILFGGGMIAAGLDFLEAIRHAIRELAFPTAWESTRVEFAELGNNAGFIGAAGWARKAILQS
jgi:glucokinase